VTFRRRLRERAAQVGGRVVFPEGGDPRVADAAAQLQREGICEPVLIGDSTWRADRDPRHPAVADLLRRRRPDRVRDGVHALDLASDPLRFGASLVAMGEASACVAGAVRTTADVIRAALWAIGTSPGIDLLSSAFYMVLADDRVLTFADCGVVAEPDPDQLARIAWAAAEDRHRLVGDAPRVAFLSFSTRGSADGPAVRLVRDALTRFRELAPAIASDGELQADAAIDPGVAARKAPGSPVAGSANVLIFPDLNAGNIAYKLIQRLAGAVALGPILQGLAAPMSDLSRGATPDDIAEVTAMVLLQGLSAT